MMRRSTARCAGFLRGRVGEMLGLEERLGY